MVKIFISVSTVVSFCLLAILLNVTTPATAGPFGILMIFIFAYLFITGILAYFLYGISRVTAHLSVALIARRPFHALTLKRSYYYSTVVAAAPIMLVGLQSVGAVGFYEFMLIILFVIIGCLYVSKGVN